MAAGSTTIESCYWLVCFEQVSLALNSVHLHVGTLPVPCNAVGSRGI